MTEIYCSAVVGRFFLEGHKKNKKCGKPDIFYDVPFSRTLEKIYLIQGKKSFLKFACRKRGYQLIAVRMHMDYLFPIGNENLFSLQQCTYVILPFEF